MRKIWGSRRFLIKCSKVSQQIQFRIFLIYFFKCSYSSRTYGSIDSGGGGGDAGGHTRPSNIRRPRQRTISTAEVVDEIERFGRSTDRLIRKRTISYCQPPDLDSLPELDRQCSENEENNATSGGGAGLNEFGEREDELSIS